MRVKVVGVALSTDGTVAHLLLSCDHITDVDVDDEESLSFMGSETECREGHS